MIEVKHLTKKYGSNTAVDDLSFNVEQGVIYGFLGPNGAGKSTTMNIITGCLAATSGDVSIDGHDIFEDPIGAKRLIGYLPEIPPLYPDMTPVEYLSFIGAVKKLKKDKLKDAVDSVIEKAAIGDVRTKLIRSLSKGYRQRVGIAAALMGDPKVIILDEPTVGLDPIQMKEIRDLIKSLGKDHTVILSSHILSEVSAVCDMILIINKGQLIACDTPENLSAKFSPDTLIEITAACGAELAVIAAGTVQGVESVMVKKSGNPGSGTETTISVKYPKELDLRLKLSKAFSDAEIPVLSMQVDRITLEDIFIELVDPDEADSDADGSIDGAVDTDDSNGEDGDNK